MVSLAALVTESARLRWMRSLEETLELAGAGPVAGLDEVGRGCLAGPVTVGAYVARPGVVIPGVDDSKKLTPQVREGLAAHLKQGALAWAVASVSSSEIDCSDILEATRRAMRAALTALRRTIEISTIVTDAVPLADAANCVAVVKADSLCYAVACASILAKVERDRAMVELDVLYPNYGFAEHKGYGSLEHREALQAFGPCPEHRLTFASVLPRRAAFRSAA